MRNLFFVLALGGMLALGVCVAAQAQDNSQPQSGVRRCTATG